MLRKYPASNVRAAIFKAIENLFSNEKRPIISA